MSRFLSWLDTVWVLGNTNLQPGKDGMFEDWWHRVFGTLAAEPGPAAILEHLQGEGFEVSGQFKGDDAGWFSAEIAFAAGLPPVQLDRYQASEDDIRDELNSWAAWVESMEEGHPHAVRLMQAVISTKQVFTVRQPVWAAEVPQAARLCQTLCQFLARQTDGVYQSDGRGIFAADGTLLVHAEE